MPFQVHIIIQDSFIVSVVYDITTPSPSPWSC